MDTNPTTDEVEIIDPTAARAAIEAAIIERLGADWRDTWLIVHDSDYYVRLNQDEKNLDFQSDLLGGVEVIEKEANPFQLSGKFIAWMVLGSSVVLALTIALVLRVI